MNTADRLMTVRELAEMLCVPVSTMYGWRSRRQGPPGYGIGRHVRYRRQRLKPG
jgi:predicted DNA-binding transcriptional regulator AlpA